MATPTTPSDPEAATPVVAAAPVAAPVVTPTPSNGQTRCRSCRQPIIWPGLCYTCATGQPRRLFRPEERIAMAAAAADAAAAEQPAAG